MQEQTIHRDKEGRKGMFREKTKEIQIGNVTIGGGNKVAIQSMTNTKTEDVEATVAQIHFDYRLAIAAIENGADKIRINPGNIGSRERVQAVVDKAKEYGVPIRVGVNSGSLEKELVEKYGSYSGRAGRKCYG